MDMDLNNACVLCNYTNRLLSNALNTQCLHTLTALVLSTYSDHICFLKFEVPTESDMVNAILHHNDVEFTNNWLFSSVSCSTSLSTIPWFMIHF